MVGVARWLCIIDRIAISPSMPTSIAQELTEKLQSSNISRPSRPERSILRVVRFVSCLMILKSIKQRALSSMRRPRAPFNKHAAFSGLPLIHQVWQKIYWAAIVKKKKKAFIYLSGSEYTNWWLLSAAYEMISTYNSFSILPTSPGLRHKAVSDFMASCQRLTISKKAIL